MVHIEDITTGACRGHLAPKQREGGTTIPPQWWEQISGKMESLRLTMWANGYLKDFLILGPARMTAFQNYRNRLCRTLRICFTLGTLVWSRPAVPHPCVLKSLGGWVWVLSLSLPFPPDTGRKKREFGNSGLIQFSQFSIFPILINYLNIIKTKKLNIYDVYIYICVFLSY